MKIKYYQVLGAEIEALTKDTDKNFNKINDLLLEHKVIFFRNRLISEKEHISLQKNLDL